jgi:hypothetical protein
MSSDSIRQQIDAMPEGAQKELAEYMRKVYRNEFNVDWEEDPRYDLLRVPEYRPKPGQFSMGSADSIAKPYHDTLVLLRESAGGWFYVKDGKLIFVNE